MLPGYGYFLEHKMPPILFWLQIIKEKVNAMLYSLHHEAWDPDKGRNKHEASWIWLIHTGKSTLQLQMFLLQLEFS